MKLTPNKTQDMETDGKMNTIIGKDSTFTGTLDVKGPVRVDGKIKGQILCSDTVTIGVGGEVEGEINCKNAAIAGRVQGNILASEKLELQAKAEIIGDLKTRSLVIEQGAVFSGSCSMKAEETGTAKYAELADKVRKDQKDPTQPVK
jgi:cytoskeletal protein CcmA (bactofilin family)